MKLLEPIILEEDVTNKSEPRNFQIARKFKENSERHGVIPFHSAVDTTAGGHVFVDIVRKLWHPDVMAVSFSGQPSEQPVSMFGSETGRDRYENRVSELWGVGHEFLRTVLSRREDSLTAGIGVQCGSLNPKDFVYCHCRLYAALATLSAAVATALIITRFNCLRTFGSLAWLAN